jgi:major intracellular serine protease
MPINTYLLKNLALTGRKKYHNQGYKGAGIRVLVIDSGVNPHEEFGSRLRLDMSKNFCITGSDPTNILDETGKGHGTGVASLIAGKNCGVAPEAEIVSYKVFNGMNECYTQWVINALKYVVNNNVDVDIINMSLGGVKYDSTTKFLYETAINACVNKGIAVIVAAGNSGKEEYYYPASFQSVISVGAVDLYKKQAWFTTMNDEVDVCQIGQEVYTAGLNNTYVRQSGTSFACPTVSGIATLLACKYKKLFGDKIPEPILYEMLKMNTIDLGDMGIDKIYGSGFCTLGNGVLIEMETNSLTKLTNGVANTMDAAPTKINGRNLIPGRDLAEPYNMEVFWDASAPSKFQFGG